MPPMKVSLSWLKDFVDLKGTPSQIAHTLTQAGIEVEGMEYSGSGYTKVVIGKVVSVEPHPNADKLVIAQVSDGQETYQVVCGAPNCRAGLKTAFALVGADLTDEEGKTFKIKKSKIRGVESNGMLCSAQELGISHDHQGIMEFADHMKEGIDLADLYADVVFDVSLTPNLSHVSSVIGTARELAASYQVPLKIPQDAELSETSPHIKDKVSVKVEASHECPRYAARLIEGVKVGPSPDWLKIRLDHAGLRSINNVVDATNYVLHELGQPLHPFDFNKLASPEVIIRKAKAGEELVTLDGKARKLEGQLVICDSKGPIALAGIMGGANSEVDENTTSVFLESAYFDPSTIRKGSKSLQLQSEASKKFERGSDPNAVMLALNRAAWLIQKLAGGEIRSGTVDIKAKEFPELVIPCRLSRINKILGTHLSVDEVETIFKNLTFKVDFDNQDTFQVAVPTFRVDITTEIDLVEEVARLWGYDNILREPARYQATQMPHAPAYIFEREVKRKLVAEGLQEFVNCDLIGPTLLKVVYNTDALPEGGIEVLNPVSIEQSQLRVSLLPGLLQVVKHNFDRENPNIAGFEVGRIHYNDKDIFKEQTVLAIVLSGKSSPNPFNPKPQAFDFRDLKGIVENLLRGLGIEDYSIRRSSLETLHPGKQASIFVGGLEVGTLGEIHPSVQRRLDVPQIILYAELNLIDLFGARKKDIKMKSLSVFPASERDWTITLIEKASVQQVIDSIKASPSNLLESISLTDIYRSPALEGKKNATFHFVYRDNLKTIEQEAVDQEHARLINITMQLITGCLP